MSLFYDPTTIQHNNSIKVEHGMNSMRNHNDSAVLELLANDLLDLGICLCIQADCQMVSIAEAKRCEEITYLLVGSSSIRILLCLRSALARQNSCFWPSDKLVSVSIASNNTPLSVSLFVADPRALQISTHLRASMISSSLAIPKGSTFCRMVPGKRKAS